MLAFQTSCHPSKTMVPEVNRKVVSTTTFIKITKKRKKEKKNHKGYFEKVRLKQRSFKLTCDWVICVFFCILAAWTAVWSNWSQLFCLERVDIMGGPVWAPVGCGEGSGEDWGWGGEDWPGDTASSCPEGAPGLTRTGPAGGWHSSALILSLEGDSVMAYWLVWWRNRQRPLTSSDTDTSAGK